MLAKLRDLPLYSALIASVRSSEGNTLEGDDERAALRLGTIIRMLDIAKPSSVIETGTNKGLFGFILHALHPGASLCTFDTDPESANAADLLREAGLNITFTLGDTRNTFSAWQGTADFAWIDGGHWGGVCASDIRNAMRLSVPVILADDMDIDEVRRDVADIMTTPNGYRMEMEGAIAILTRI